MSDYPCPHCNSRQFETVQKVMYVRGFLIAYQKGEKTFIGCVPCVANQLRIESGKSLLYGWFSVQALIHNVFLVPLNLIRSFTVSADPAAVNLFLREAGVPTATDASILEEAMYVFAATLIKSDGEINDSEITSAIEIGRQITEDFDDKKFLSQLNASQSVSEIEDLGGLVRDILSNPQKQMVVKYLLLIAFSDGDFAEEEKTTIEGVAISLGLEKESVDQLVEAFMATEKS